MTESDRANRLLMSGVRRIEISSVLLAWQMGLIPGVFLGDPLGFAGMEICFCASVALISSANDLHPVTAATFMTAVRSSATDAFVFDKSWERSDIVSSKKYE